MIKPKKSQAALEYLTTYGWAFLVIIVIIGAFSYYGLLDFDKYLPKRCIFSSQFPCVDYAVRTTGARKGTVLVRVRNDIGTNLKITKITLFDETQKPIPDCQLSINNAGVDENSNDYNIAWNKGIHIDVLAEGCTHNGFVLNDRFEAGVALRYYSPETETITGKRYEHETNGKIIASVEQPRGG